MLTLNRRIGESIDATVPASPTPTTITIVVPPGTGATGLTVTLRGAPGTAVRLGVDADRRVIVDRSEVRVSKMETLADWQAWAERKNATAGPRVVKHGVPLEAGR